MDVGGKDMTSDPAFRRSVGTRIVGAGVGLTVALLLTVGDRAAAQWFYQNPLPQPNSLSDVAFIDAQTGMALHAEGIIRTEDGGNTWIVGKQVTESSSLNALSLVDENTATVVGFTDGFSFNAFIARTNDGGSTWTHQLSGADMPVTALLDVFFTDPDFGVVVGAHLSDGTPAILRTTDGGTTWTPSIQIDGPAISLLYGVSFADSTTGVAVGVSFDTSTGEPSSVILRTTDGGETWSLQLHDTSTSGGINSVAFVDSSAGIAVGAYGVVLTTTDGGESWVHQETDTDRNLVALSCLDALNCIAVGGGPGDGQTVGRTILRTTDGGESWASLLLEEESSSLNGAVFHDSTTLTVVGGQEDDGAGGVILRSTDGGATWRRLNRTVTAVALFDTFFTNTSVGTAVGDDGTILRTLDGGSTWIHQTSGTTLPLFGVSFADDLNGVAVGGAGGGLGGVVLQTADGGDTWSSLTLENEQGRIALLDVSCTGFDHCTAVGSVGEGTPDNTWGVIARTDDGGSNWIVKVSEDFGIGVNSVHCTDQLNCTAVGRNVFSDLSQFILQTVDGGETWSRTVTEASGLLRSVFTTDAQTGMAVGWGPEGRTDEGIVLRTTDGGATWVTVLETDERLEDITFADGERGVIVGADGTILRTTDGGMTWIQDKDTPAGVGFLWAVALSDADRATAVGGGGQVLRTVGSPTFPLSLAPSSTFACVPDGSPEAVEVVIGAGSAGGYAGTVELSITGEPSGVTSELNPSFVETPGSSVWTLSVDPSAPTGQHVITLTADDGAQQQIANFRLGVVDPGSSPGLVSPFDGATDVAARPTFTWQPILGADGYRIQVATDGTFDEPVIDAEVTGASFTPPAELDSDTQYFWRVQGIVEGTHGCSLAWSAVSSFTTAPRPIAEVTPEGVGFEVPVGGGDSANVSVANAGTGNLVWELSTAQPTAVAGAPAAGGGRAPARTAARSHAAHNDSDAALDLASLLGEPLPGLRPSPPAAGLVDCSDEPSLIVHDDGTVETGYIANPEVVDQVAFVDRFTPYAYPVTFTSVCVAFISTGPTGLDFEIVVYDDDGPQGGPGTELGALPVSVEGIPVVPPISEAPAWFSIDVSALGASISSGSAYIGVRWVPSDPGVFLAADESPEHPVGFAGGYWWHDVGNVWAPTESAFANYRSLFVRAKSIPGGCHDPATIPWLSVSPNSGITPAGGSTPVQVVVNAAGLDVGQHTANLCIASNDPENPMVAVPISLTVVGSELTLDQQGLDFGDVFVNDTSDPQVVTLQNTGSLDATGLGFQVTGSGFEVDASACGTTLDRKSVV